MNPVNESNNDESERGRSKERKKTQKRGRSSSRERQTSPFAQNDASFRTPNASSREKKSRSTTAEKDVSAKAPVPTTNLAKPPRTVSPNLNHEQKLCETPNGRGNKSVEKKSTGKNSAGKRPRSELKSKSTGPSSNEAVLKKRKDSDDEVSGQVTPIAKGKELTNDELLKALEWDLVSKAKSQNVTVKGGLLLKNGKALTTHTDFFRLSDEVKLLYGVGHPVIVENSEKTTRHWVRIKRDNTFEQADEMHLFVSNKEFLKYLALESKSHSSVSGHAQRLLDQNPVITFHPHSNDTDRNLHLTVRTNKRPQKHVYVKSLGGRRKKAPKKTPSFVWNKTRYVMTGVDGLDINAERKK